MNKQLIQATEREVVDRLVQKMLSLNLSFVQDKNELGELFFKLEPFVLPFWTPSLSLTVNCARPIDQFVHYEGKRAADIAPSRYAVRHFISQEVCSFAMVAPVVKAHAARADGGGTNST
jgi:chromosome transmission fidelity protein 18